MSSAGQRLVAGRIPGEEIGVTLVTADSAGFTTTDIELASIELPVINGRIYWVCYDFAVQSTVTGDAVRIQILSGAITGTQINVRHHHLGAGTAEGCQGRARFTATSTTNQQFTLAGRRQSGSGTLNVNAAADFPSFLWVEYVKG